MASLALLPVAALLLLGYAQMVEDSDAAAGRSNTSTDQRVICCAVPPAMVEYILRPKELRMETAINSKPADAAAVADLTSSALIDRQRTTVAEHISHEQVKNWPEVYRTFTPHEDDAYYDVVPFQMRFQKMKGVVDFYETFTSAFPDFRIIVHTENDVPGLSIREAQIVGTHMSEYCGLQPSGRQVSVALIGLFVFDQKTGHLNAERIYFDNNTILAQIRGEISPSDVFDLRRIEQNSAAAAGES